MTAIKAIRWSDNDHYFGPFTYARERGGYRTFACLIGSGEEEYPGCRLRISAFGHTVIVALPAIVRPWRRKVVSEYWDEATVARMGRNWYWEIHPREYGITYREGFLNVSLGRQTNDSKTEQRWSKFLPWANWRHVRHSLYDLQGNHFWTESSRCVGAMIGYEERLAAEDKCPSVTFPFTDFDGEQLTAKTRIEEREWRFGTGWFKWLSFFRRPKISRSLDIAFSGETGKRKGSWKGGTIGHSIEMMPGELHESAFRRYCEKRDMTFGHETAANVA